MLNETKYLKTDSAFSAVLVLQKFFAAKIKSQQKARKYMFNIKKSNYEFKKQSPINW